MPIEDDQDLEGLLRQITVARVRGDWTRARVLAEEAVQQAPQRADLHELLGDILRQLGDKEGALACYQRARDLEPQRPSAEEKFAATLLELQSFEVPDDEVPAFPKNPMVAATLSAVLPGTGQLYNEQWLKGMLFCLGTLAPVGAFLQIYKGLLRPITFDRLPSPPSNEHIVMAAVLGIIALAMWVWNIWDAYQTALAFQQPVSSRQERITQ